MSWVLWVRVLILRRSFDEPATVRAAMLTYLFGVCCWLMMGLVGRWTWQRTRESKAYDAVTLSVVHSWSIAVHCMRRCRHGGGVIVSCSLAPRPRPSCPLVAMDKGKQVLACRETLMCQAHSHRLMTGEQRDYCRLTADD